MLAYLDDWITWAPNKIVLQINLRKIISSLENLCFLINYKKSQLKPTTDISWIGVRWFLQDGLWDVPPSFKDKISIDANRLLHSRVVSKRCWESFIGKLAFLGQIHRHLRPNISLLSHPQYLAPAKLRDKKVLLPKFLMENLRTWISPAALPGPTPFLQPYLKIALWTDASLSGWGAHSDKGHYCQGLWSKEEIALHINALEVLAVIRTMETLDLSNLHISLHTDNEVARFVINNLRSKAPALFPLLSMLCLLLKSRNLSITASRIPSSLNLIADALSRDHPLPTEWSLPQEVFDKIIAWRGPVEVDLMATIHNRKVETFVSPLPRPAAAAIDVITVDWKQMESSVCLLPEDVHDATSPQAPLVPVPRGPRNSLATISSVVPRTLQKGRSPFAPSRPARTIRILRKSLKWLPKLRALDRLHFLKEVYTASRGATVANSLVHDFRKSAINQAETAWRAFKEWLPDNLTVLRKTHVLEFLVFLRNNKKLSPRTILGYRHSLSIPFKEAFEINFADRNFSLLAKAQFHLSPPTQRKLPQWSLNHALEILQTPRFRNSTASSEDLFLKTIFLVAVASGNRCSELAACTREGITFDNNTVTIPTKEGFLFKNQTLNRTPPPVTFPSLLCPFYLPEEVCGTPLLLDSQSYLYLRQL